ncbi:MogA/MoaB family molybdenum cofactor biosynthesis protein [Aquipuribacter sp. SD81]|uniref:MogA/MoaB family molybdenum cofactor biosynthesis protein n=1 Tax=Aquipuribacter sp. SD81 TaxID=3127703 RepID=UPI00301A3C49
MAEHAPGGAGSGAASGAPVATGRAVVVTVSTSAAAGTAADRSGPLLVDGLRGLGLDTPDARVVPDGDAVADALRSALADGADVVLLTGGTGLSPDDTTPEQVRPLLEREVPGIAEALRADGRARGVATAALSRSVAGVAGRSLVVALPGSTGACRDALEVLGPLLPHAVALLGGTPGERLHPGGRGDA